MIYMTKCEICNKQLEYVNASHLRIHKISVKEYEEKFPDCDRGVKEIGEKIGSTLSEGLESGKITHWTQTDKKEEECKKIVASRREHFDGNYHPDTYQHFTKTKSEEEIKEIYNRISKKSSETLLERFASGELIAWQTGYTKDTHEGIRKQSENQIKTKSANPEKYSGKNNGMFGKNFMDLSIAKYVEQKALEMLEERRQSASDKWPGSGNPMYQISVFDIWIEKYGEKEAIKMWKEKYDNLRGRNSPRFGKQHILKRCLYKNIWFKSTWEAMFAYEMDLLNIKWEYEKYKIQVIENKTYRPDFIIYDINGKIIKIIEVKGYKDGSEILPILLQKCCLISVELYDKNKLEELDIFKHKKTY